MSESLFQQSCRHDFPCQFCEIFWNIFFHKKPPVVASVRKWMISWKYFSFLQDTLCQNFIIQVIKNIKVLITIKHLHHTFAFDFLPATSKITSPYALVSFLPKCSCGFHFVSSPWSILPSIWTPSMLLDFTAPCECSSLVRPQWHL